MTERFAAQLALTGSVDEALASTARAGVPAGAGTVRQEEEAVIIGGIRVPRVRPGSAPALP